MPTKTVIRVFFLSIQRILQFLKYQSIKYFNVFDSDKDCGFKTEVFSKTMIFFLKYWRKGSDPLFSKTERRKTEVLVSQTLRTCLVGVFVT